VNRRTVALGLLALCLTACGATSPASRTAPAARLTQAAHRMPAAHRTPAAGPSPPACGPARRAWADEVSDSGTVAWQVRLPTDPTQSGVAVRPLAIGGEAVFAEFNGVYALRLRDGRQLWRRTFPAPKAYPFAGMVYGLWQWRGTVVALIGQVSSAARLVSLNAATGAVRWTLPLSRQGVTGNLTLTGDGGLAMIQGYGTLSVADLTTGRLRWSRTAGHSPGPVAVGTVVAAAANGRAVGYDDRTGAVLWTKSGLPAEPALAAADGLVLVQSDVSGGVSPTAVTALAPRTGRVAWRFDPGAAVTIAGAGPAGIIMSTYIPDRLYLVSPATGRPRWTAVTVATYTWPNPEVIVTAVSVVLVEGRGEARLVDRRAADGKVLWSAPLPGSSIALHLALKSGPSGPDVAVTMGAFGAGTTSWLRVFRLSSGRLAGTAALPSLVQAPLAVAGAATLVQLDDPVCATPAIGTAQAGVGHSSLRSTASPSISIGIFSLTMTPPGTGALKLTPKSFLLISVRALNPARVPPYGSGPKPPTSTSSVTGLVTPRMVRSPVTLYLSPSGVTLVDLKVISGWLAVSRKRSERRSSSRISLPVSTEAVSIEAVTVESTGLSAVTICTSNLVKRPRTLLTMRWRAANPMWE